MKIKSKIKDYDVILEDNLDFLTNVLKTENLEIVIDKDVYILYEDYFSLISKEALFLLEANEENKVINTVLSICEKIMEMPSKRNTVLLSIGGGIIQDITGFVANVIYRGIRWIFIPTTLLAACDSCIGGKTSLNYKTYKNLLGTFYPPDEIHICSQMFRTLGEKEFKSGLGKVIKFNIMSGKKGLEDIENNLPKLLQRDVCVINHFVEKSLLFKKDFIEKDEFDRGERIKLNFAHTFGHAIEVITNYEIPHGTAVAIGMIIANKISYDRGLLSKNIIQRCEKTLLTIIDIDCNLLEKPIEDYLKVIHKDKKQINNELTAVLITQYGSMPILTVVHDVLPDEIQNAVLYFISLYQT